MFVFGDAAPGDWCAEFGDIWKAVAVADGIDPGDMKP